MNNTLLENKIREDFVKKLTRVDEADLWLRNDGLPLPEYEEVKIPIGAGLYNLIRNQVLDLVP